MKKYILVGIILSCSCVIAQEAELQTKLQQLKGLWQAALTYKDLVLKDLNNLSVEQLQKASQNLEYYIFKVRFGIEIITYLKNNESPFYSRYARRLNALQATLPALQYAKRIVDGLLTQLAPQPQKRGWFGFARL